MNRRKSHQPTLPFRIEQTAGLATQPAPSQCRELLSQLLIEVIKGELNLDKETPHEREDPTKPS